MNTLPNTTIWKYTLPVIDRPTLTIPAGARPIAVQTQRAGVHRRVEELWAHTRRRLVMNFLTYKPDWTEDDLWYPDSPHQIVDWVSPPAWSMAEDYGLKGEWTLALEAR